MALLVATAGNPKRGARSVGAGVGAHGIASASSSDSHGARGAAGVSSSSTTTTTAPVSGANTAATALASTHAATVPTTVPSLVPATTTTVPPVVTTTTTAPPPPIGSSSHQGVIEPPAQRSSSVGFSGTGAMQISVVWSGSTYLTMQVSCPNGTQNVGGSSAMAASLPDASGNCLATVSEPASESTALTYTITIGPAGG